jgi:phage baseplate assembly protein W
VEAPEAREAAVAQRPDFNKPPWLGKGIAFPLRLNPSTGGLQMTEGTTDPTVGLEWVSEQFTIREDVGDLSNHLRESMMHIIMTTPGERDWLPEFGSRPMQLINLPNTEATQQVWEVYCEESTIRWEKRVTITAPEDFDWRATPYTRDHNVLPVILRPRIIRNQVPGNLVSPFVGPREARAQEYTLGQMDSEGHDWMSRYHGMEAYTDGEVRFIREPLPAPLPPRSDDQFIEVGLTDTWLLIAYRVFGDVRAWWTIAEMAIEDAAERGESWDAMDICGDLEPNTFLRCPSDARLYMEILG